MTKAELLALVDADHRRWREAIAEAGDRVDVAGAAGEWTLRDVIAHITAYHRFLVTELGGEVRPFPELREHDGNDVEARNAAMHEADLDRSWTEVDAELDTVHAALVAQVEARTEEQLDRPMTDWAPLSVREWVSHLTAGHWDEHEADLRAFLRDPGTPG